MFGSRFRTLAVILVQLFFLSVFMRSPVALLGSAPRGLSGRPAAGIPHVALVCLDRFILGVALETKL